MHARASSLTRVSIPKPMRPRCTWPAIAALHVSVGRSSPPTYRCAALSPVPHRGGGRGGGGIGGVDGGGGASIEGGLVFGVEQVSSQQARLCKV